ncbi:MAG: hypothetical protein M3540_10965 [Actinomycetota bacterium]|nr:hypothetical protein [Actinomycetota bacterium]
MRPPGDFVAVMAKATGHDIEFFYIEGEAAEDEEEKAAAALRHQAHELVAPLNDSMVDALMAELQERQRTRA